MGRKKLVRLVSKGKVFKNLTDTTLIIIITTIVTPW